MFHGTGPQTAVSVARPQPTAANGEPNGAWHRQVHSYGPVQVPIFCS